MQSVDRMMETGIKKGVFPGAVLLGSVQNEIRYFKAFGACGFASKHQIKKDFIFDLASLTKPLATVLAIFKLIESNKISLDNKLLSIMPGVFFSDKAEITIRQLLNHSSGLPPHREYFKELMKFPMGVRREKLHELIINEALLAEKGKIQAYSDLGFIILAWIVEFLSGEGIDVFVRREIYNLLGVDDLFFIDLFDPDSHIPDDKYERIVPTENCPWRKKTLRAEVHDDNAWAAGGVAGHAGLFGDAFSVWKILMEIMKALQGKDTKAINSDLFIQFMEKEKGSGFRSGFDTPSKNSSSSGRYFSDQSLGHLGFTGTSFWMDPEQSIAVILLTNRVHPDRENKAIKVFRPEIHNLLIEKIV